MKSLALSILLSVSVALTACNSKPEKPLIGRWAVDVEAMVKPDQMADQLVGMTAEEKEQRLAAARAEAARIQLEVEEGKLIVDTGLDRQETRFTAHVRPEDGKLVLETTDDPSGEKQTFECSLEGDRLHMTWGKTKLILVKR